MKKKKSQNNLVAKHAIKFNRHVVHKDKKKSLKRGECKHKNQRSECYQIAA
jgi:hypothetical protein